MYLGVDLGTSSLKVLLCDCNGKILDTAKKDYECSCTQLGYSEQNPDDWLQALIFAIDTLKQKYDIKAIKAISFCGQMHGLVLLDKDDNVIRPAILWNDNRSTVETEFVNRTVGIQNLLHSMGNIAFTGFTAPKLLWVKNNEKSSFDKISKIMLPKDYLLYKISGVFASDVTDNSGTLYFDIKNRTWSKPMLDLLGITTNQLPKIFESYQVIGTVQPSFAKVTGLAQNTKIVAGGGDQAVGAVGTGTVTSGKINISLGTSGVVFASVDGYRQSNCTGIHNFCHCNGLYHFMGCMLSCAASVDFWLRNIFDNVDYKNIFEQLKYVKDNQIIFLPYLCGERSPINDPNAKGLLYGLEIGHGRQDIAKAVVEGVCFGLKDCFEEIKKMGIATTEISVIGGLSKSSWVLETLATAIGSSINTLETSDGGAFGACILAMVGDGVFSSVADACKRLVKVGRTYYPNSKLEHYNQKFERYKELYNKIK